MNKIAKHIVGEDADQQAFRSIKLGLCQAMSDFGLSPKEAEEILQKTAGLGDLVKGWIPSPIDLLKNWTLMMGAGGVAAGIGTAALRRKIERTAQGAESPEMRITSEKIKAYKKMIENLKEEDDLRARLETSGSV